MHKDAVPLSGLTWPSLKLLLSPEKLLSPCIRYSVSRHPSAEDLSCKEVDQPGQIGGALERRERERSVQLAVQDTYNWQIKFNHWKASS